MVVTQELHLPDPKSLNVEELRLTQAHLMAAAPYVGKYCENVNNEFMLCRQELKDPRACVNLGKEVTGCAMEFFLKLKDQCICEHNQYANCIDKSSGNFKPWLCRKTHEAYKLCIKDNLGVEYPGFGYHARGRIHKTQMEEKPERIPSYKCDEQTKKLPDDFPRKEPRFGSRWYWMTE